MLVGGVKITLIICLTILVSAVLLISYNEYTNRYSIVTTQDNNVYIFDKKSTILNKCGEKGCQVIETKLPSKMSFGVDELSGTSKLFGSEKNMSEAIVKKEAKKEDKTQETMKPEEREEDKENESSANSQKNTDTKSDGKKTEFIE